MISKGFVPVIPVKTKWGMPIDETLAKEMVEVSVMAHELKNKLPRGAAYRKLPRYYQQLVNWYRDTFNKLERSWNVFPTDLYLMSEHLEFTVQFDLEPLLPPPPLHWDDPRRGDPEELRMCLRGCKLPPEPVESGDEDDSNKRSQTTKRVVMVDQGGSLFRAVEPPHSYVIDVVGRIKCMIGCYNVYFG